MALPYSAVSWSLRAAVRACPKVALYSNVKPVSPSASRKLRQASPPDPLCPSSTKIRLLPSKASTGTLTPPPRFSSTSLVISMTRTTSLPDRHQTALVQVEPPGRNARGRHLRHVLIAQALVGRDQQDVVQGPVVVVQELPVVDMHDERLAAAGRHPEGQLLQVRLGELRVLRLTGGLRGVTLLDEAVQRAKQLASAMEVPVQEDFRVENGEVLEVAKRDRLGPPGVHGRRCSRMLSS